VSKGQVLFTAVAKTKIEKEKKCLIPYISWNIPIMFARLGAEYFPQASSRRCSSAVSR
jgi:hypothetical protein